MFLCFRKSLILYVHQSCMLYLFDQNTQICNIMKYYYTLKLMYSFENWSNAENSASQSVSHNPSEIFY